MDAYKTSGSSPTTEESENAYTDSGSSPPTVTPVVNPSRRKPGPPRQTHCKRGHSLSNGNLYIRRNGDRQCRECTNTYNRAYRTTHLERFRARARTRRAENLKKVCALDRAYRPKNPERAAYNGAKRRCTTSIDRAWKNYGGRGIEFRFESFEQFFAELGKHPKGKLLDRINNDGHYEPGNVRWATRSESNRNRRATRTKDQLEQLSEVPGTVVASRKWRVGVKTAGDLNWVFNQLRFDSEAEAERYAQDLLGRWTAVQEFVVEEVQS